MTATAELSAGSFLVGSGATLAVVVVLAWGAWRLRGRLLPDWVGPPARLAEALLVLLGLTASAEILGAVDALRGGPLFAMCAFVGLGMALLGHPRRAQQLTFPVRGSSETASPRREILVAGIASAIVAAQWVSHAAHALHRGMLQPDTLNYHAPFAARMLQDGTFTSLTGIGTRLLRVYPQNSELLHAVAAVPFHADLLSPLLNLAWAALVGLAAWCVGRRRGAGALAVLGAAVVLGLPSWAGTQPGQASNDVVSSALLVTAVALLLESRVTPTTAALAGAAAGLAVGTKLTVAAPVVVLTVGVVVLLLRERRKVAALSWCSALVLAGGYWYVRDWIVAGSPAPFLNVSIGPISLRGSAPATGATEEAAVHYFTNGTVWRRYYLPGLSHGFGPAWPLVLSLGVGAAVATLWHRLPLERLAGLAVFVGICAYPFIPATAASGGRGFVADLRFLASVLLLAFILLSLSLIRAPTAWRWGACLAMLGLVVLSTALPDFPGEPMPAWPADGLLAGVVAGFGVVAVLAMRARVSVPMLRVQPGRLAVASIALSAAIVTGGWFVQREYFAGRYLRTGLPDNAMFGPFRTIHNASVAVFGVLAIYPMFGPDLSNRVTRPSGPTSGTNRQLCRDWKRVLSGRYRYVVLERNVFFFRADFLPSEAWFFDPAVVNVVHGHNYTVLRLDGELNGRLCRPLRIKPPPRAIPKPPT